MVEEGNMRLTRKTGESVELFRGSETLGKITIRQIRGNRVVIEIVCPYSIDIFRTELINRETSDDAIEVD